MADHDEMISQFKDVTGVDTERAQFYLESTAWQLEVSKIISTKSFSNFFLLFIYLQ